MDLTAGTVVAERFRLERKLGEGGMGAVWLAHHVKLDMPCAVKFIHADVASSAGVIERFEREAKIAGQIKSTHVVQVLDFGTSSGVPYLAMEFLDGEDLAHRLAARGRLSPEEAVPIVAQISRALMKAHGAGLVHRDLKPENVFIVRDDDQEVVKVLDFGIAKVQNPLADSKTRTGTLMGTPCFMSPEQAQGMKTLDHRSDLWSLGVIAYRCIVGALPFDSDAIGDLMMRIIVHPLPVPSEVLPGLPVAFDAWWSRAAARDPAERFQSAKEQAEALAEVFGLSSASSNIDRGAAALRASVVSAAESSSPRAVTPPLGAAMSASMISAATMVPRAGLVSASTGASGGATPVPHQTMSPASRTFLGAEQARRKLPVWIFAVSGVAVLAIAAVVFLVVDRESTHATATSEPSGAASAPSTSAVNSAQPASAPTVAPEPAAEPTAEPSASASADPTSAPTHSATVPVAHAKVPLRSTLVSPQPAARPQPPARRGKVRIAPPTH